MKGIPLKGDDVDERYIYLISKMLYMFIHYYSFKMHFGVTIKNHIELKMLIVPYQQVVAKKNLEIVVSSYLTHRKLKQSIENRTYIQIF